MRISPITQYTLPLKSRHPQDNNKKTNNSMYTSNPLQLQGHNDYLISFTSRVDKSLERFYEFNKERMPITVKEYIETLDDKSQMTPLEAQRNAFEYLKEPGITIEDIKGLYPNEPLFKSLIDPQKSAAPTGIFKAVKEYEEILALDNKGVLKSKENLTVYLVKKIFVENKTINEINEDLERDLDEDFKVNFKFKNEDATYIHASTFDSIGLKRPNPNYRNSLRYTQEGYADLMGDIQRKFWESIPLEERTTRAKKSVEKFEIWWNSMSNNQKLDMIADQQNELDMLKDFKRKQREEQKANSTTKSTTTTPENIKITPERTHTKVGSTKLSQDELFIRWAKNNLKLYLENLSEAEKDTLHIKSMQRLASRWAEMTPTERTEYISKMKSGSEPLRFAMIDTWNHSLDIIVDLSNHLKEKDIFNTTDLLYSQFTLSERQSEAMTEFWANHPEHAKNLGTRLVDSHQKVRMAISRGTFEELKKQIMRNKTQRLKEFAKIKTTKTITNLESSTPQYMRDFKQAYHNRNGHLLENLPISYVKDYFKIVEKDFKQNEVEAWTKALNFENLSKEESELLQKIKKFEPYDGQIINRALETAIAKNLFECTNDSRVFTLNHTQLKIALHQAMCGVDTIRLHPPKEDTPIAFRILNSKKLSKTEIHSLYETIKKSRPQEVIEEFAQSYFHSVDGSYDKLVKYLTTFGRTLDMVFSDTKTLPTQAKQVIVDKIRVDMPKEIANNHLQAFSTIYEEMDLQKVMFKFQQKYKSTLPAEFLQPYAKSIATVLRKGKIDNADEIYYAMKNNNGDYVFDSKEGLDLDSKLRCIAMETALSDACYGATKNPQIYGLEVEDFDKLIKTLKSKASYPQSVMFSILNKQYETFTFTKRPNLTFIKQSYKEYLQELKEYAKEVGKDGAFDLDEIVYILNPKEGNPAKDLAIKTNLKKYMLKVIK